jgi:hypothetical protein
MPYRSPDRWSVTPQNRGRFAGFDVLDQVEVWDDVTAGVVLSRLALSDEFSFFTPAEVGIGMALVDLLLAQDCDPRVPVLALIDQRLSIGETDGWHYDDLPEDAAAWRASLAGLDLDAREQCGRGFGELGETEQGSLVQAVQDRSTAGDRWRDFVAKHVWSLWTRYACTAFYSHPWAWNEIGFSGPAYPRGYLNLGLDAREKWEVAEHEAADPVPFASRVERARRDHEDVVGPGPS